MFITVEWWVGNTNLNKIYKPLTRSKNLEALLMSTGFPVDIRKANTLYASRRLEKLHLSLKFGNPVDEPEVTKELCVKIKDWLLSFAETQDAVDYKHTMTVSAEQTAGTATSGAKQLINTTVTFLKF